jgi:hypothetical protein
MTRGRRLLLAVPLGLVAAFLIWQGDAHLVHRDWLVGGAIFALGLGAAFLTVRQLRLAGLVR